MDIMGINMTKEKMTKLFVYGVLQDSDLLNTLIKRKPDMTIAHLEGFSLYNVFGDLHKQQGFIVKAIKTEGLYLNGRVIEVTDDELRILDNFEGSGYKRETVLMYEKIEVDIYC